MEEEAVSINRQYVQQKNQDRNRKHPHRGVKVLIGYSAALMFNHIKLLFPAEIRLY